MSVRRKGVVTRFGSKGFGFLTDIQNRESFFVHVRDVDRFIELREGDRVEFEAGERRDARDTTRRAIQVSLISKPTKAAKILSTDDLPRPASAPASPGHAVTAAAALAEVAPKAAAPKDGSAQ